MTWGSQESVRMLSWLYIFPVIEAHVKCNTHVTVSGLLRATFAAQNTHHMMTAANMATTVDDKALQPFLAVSSKSVGV